MSGARRRERACAHRDGQLGPVRTCVGCRQRAASSTLLRVVAGDGELVLDVRHRLPGRGAWLHPDSDCLRRARRRGAFERALRARGRLAATEVVAYLTPGD